MVIELAEFNVVPGREDEFLAHTEQFRARFEATVGCGGFRYGRGVESPSKIVYVVDWNSVEAHMAARGEPWFADFAKPLMSMVTERASAEHFTMAAR